MVLYVMTWDICNDTRESYGPWAQQALQQVLGTGDVVEFRAYRPTTGTAEVAATYEFADMASFAHWHESEAVKAVFGGMRQYCENVSAELWGPSPIVPAPIRS